MHETVVSARRLRGVTLRAAPQPYCQVCFGPQTRLRVVRDPESKRKVAARVCPRCGYVELPDNAGAKPGGTPPSAPRARNRRTTELGMVRLAADVLSRDELSVAICGVGPRADNRRVSRLPQVERVAAEDLDAMGDYQEFAGRGYAGGERFDVVVAANVIDRFEDPHVGFAKIFNLVAADGVLICLTSIYDGGDLRKQRRIFTAGRVSYYTPESLRRIAHAHDLRVDFRMPAPGARRRKRYVIFSRSDGVMESVSDYFGRHRFAPPGAVAT
jgi:SAM-dependent methyltransferase